MFGENVGVGVIRRPWFQLPPLKFSFKRKNYLLMFDMKLITQHNIECLPDPSQQRSRWQQAQTGLLQYNHKIQN
jgi:hypothetical protein